MIRSSILIQQGKNKHIFSRLKTPSVRRFGNGKSVDLVKAERCAKVGAYSDLILAGSKGVMGFAANSPALLADAVHSLADVLADLVAIYSLKEARKPADWDHPFGHGKFESVGAAAIGGVLVATGAGLVSSNASKISELLSHSTPAQALLDFSNAAADSGLPLEYAGVTAAACLLIKEGLYRWTLRVAKLANSSSMVANAHHHRSDALSSAVVLVGISGSLLCGSPWMDPLAGLLVSGMVVKAGVDCIKGAAHELTDQAPEPLILARLTSLVAAVPGVKLAGWAPVRARFSGPDLHVSAAITVDSSLTASAAHQIGEHVRFVLLTAPPFAREDADGTFTQVAHVVVHIDPEEREELLLADAQDGEPPRALVQLLPTPMEVEAAVRAVVRRHCPNALGVAHVFVRYGSNNSNHNRGSSSGSASTAPASSALGEIKTHHPPNTTITSTSSPTNTNDNANDNANDNNDNKDNNRTRISGELAPDDDNNSKHNNRVNYSREKPRGRGLHLKVSNVTYICPCNSLLK
jgi:cation diffusion facilitator family transporter